MSTTPVPGSEVTFGDKTVETAQFERYKGGKNRIDRISIVSSKLYRAHAYYHESTKNTFRAPTNPAVLKAVKDAMGEPSQRFAFALFHYQTDDHGNLVDDKKCAGRMKIWRISDARYEELSQLHRQWPLLDAGFGQPQHDLIIKCTEEQFQKMTFTPCPSAHWKSKEGWYNALKEKEKLAKGKINLALGLEKPDQEILALLGSSAPPTSTGSTSNANDIDLGDVLDDEVAA